MKIQNEPVVAQHMAPLDPSEKGKTKDRTQEAESAVDREINDTAEISKVAARLKADPARLEKLRQAVQAGTYKVSAENISERLIDEHLDKP